MDYLIQSNVTFTSMINTFFMGIGFCYSIENKEYYDLPAVIIFPTAYMGYIMYKNKDNLIQIYENHIRLFVGLFVEIINTILDVYSKKNKFF